LALDNPENAIEFLEDAIRNSTDKRTRDVLGDRLKEVYFEVGFRQLEKSTQDFMANNGRAPASLDELTAAGLLPNSLQKSGFEDPFGGHYYIDSKSGRVLSTSFRKREASRWNRPHAAMPQADAPSKP